MQVRNDQKKFTIRLYIGVEINLYYFAKIICNKMLIAHLLVFTAKELDLEGALSIRQRVKVNEMALSKSVSKKLCCSLGDEIWYNQQLAQVQLESNTPNVNV